MSQGGSEGLGCVTIALPFQIWPLHFVLTRAHREVIADESKGTTSFYVMRLSWDNGSYREAIITNLLPLAELSMVCKSPIHPSYV